MKKKVMLNLSKNIYDYSKIKNTVEAFEGIVNLDVYEEKERYICLFDNFKLDPSKTIMEFENYLINLMNRSEDVN